MFHLTKWYLDLVTEDGAAIIGYAARLRWGRLRVGYEAVFHSAAGASTRESTTFSQGVPPELVGDCLTWRSAPLGVEGEWRRLAPPFRKRLLHEDRGELVWTCHVPRSDARVAVNGRCVRGVGYVEHLSMTIPPWTLPFNGLRWGRHASDRHAIVWIDWSGASARTLIWHDGVEVPGATLDIDGVSLPDGGALRLGKPRDLCARPALGRIMGALPRRSRVMASPLAAMFEHKMIAPSRFVQPGRASDAGWTVFEEVQW